MVRYDRLHRDSRSFKSANDVVPFFSAFTKVSLAFLTNELANSQVLVTFWNLEGLNGGLGGKLALHRN